MNEICTVLTNSRISVDILPSISTTEYLLVNGLLPARRAPVGIVRRLMMGMEPIRRRLHVVTVRVLIRKLVRHAPRERMLSAGRSIGCIGWKTVHNLSPHGRSNRRGSPRPSVIRHGRRPAAAGGGALLEEGGGTVDRKLERTSSILSIVISRNRLGSCVNNLSSSGDPRIAV